MKKYMSIIGIMISIVCSTYAMEKSTMEKKRRASFRNHPARTFEVGDPAHYVSNLHEIVTGIVKNYTEIVKSEKLNESETREIKDELLSLKMVLQISESAHHSIAEGVTSPAEGRGYEFLKNLIKTMYKINLSLETFAREGKMDNELYKAHTFSVGQLACLRFKIQSFKERHMPVDKSPTSSKRNRILTALLNK